VSGKSQILTELQVARHVEIKVPNTNFTENPSCRNPASQRLQNILTG